MSPIISITIKGIVRDRVFQGIGMFAMLFLLIPSVSSLSMRQVVELSLTLSLSLISFMMLLLSVFLGGVSLWRDMERRYVNGVLGLPVSRTSYLLGKFTGIAIFLLLTCVLLGAIAGIVVYKTTIAYPPLRPVIWKNLVAAVAFIYLKYVLLVALAFLLSTVSTSFFLPIFGTIAVFFAGNASQQVYDYLTSSAGRDITPIMKQAATVLYYFLPNFSAFDLSANAIYGVNVSSSGMLLTVGYSIVYAAIVLTSATIVFSRREMV